MKLQPIITTEDIFRAGFRAGAEHGLDYNDLGNYPIDGVTHEDKAWEAFQASLAASQEGSK